jgi:hypothetical protein
MQGFVSTMIAQSPPPDVRISGIGRIGHGSGPYTEFIELAFAWPSIGAKPLVQRLCPFVFVPPLSLHAHQSTSQPSYKPLSDHNVALQPVMQLRTARDCLARA